MNLPPCSGCQDNPCKCHIPIQSMYDNVNPDPGCCSMCVGRIPDNMFWELGGPGFPGRCKLDLMTYDQVHHVLRRVPAAKAHLLAITADPILRRMAYETKLTESDADDDARATERINANTLPFYTVLRGNNGGGF